MPESLLGAILKADHSTRHEEGGGDKVIPALHASRHNAGGLDALTFPAGAPTGSAMVWFTDTAPTDWLLCYGQAVSRSTYAALFAVLSTTFGVGDGSTTFNLPDTRGRTLVGQDDMGGVAASRLAAANAIGVVGGSATHTLTTGEIPSHSHSHTHGAHNHTDAGAAGGGNTAGQALIGQMNSNSPDTLTTDNTTPSADATTAGGGGSHNIVQPYITVNWIIRT